ncbi:MAG: hypothetical protein IPL51_15575 [Candidatus Competibacteraceae bacterium]|nr:hypothetical protein [Candidatus Competibacteraceae bacterium]
MTVAASLSGGAETDRVVDLFSPAAPPGAGDARPPRHARARRHPAQPGHC